MDTVVLDVDMRTRQIGDLTDDVAGFCAGRGDGLCSLFAPHATAGLGLMELGSGSEGDLLDALQRLLPRDGRYRHAHGSPGHGADHLLPVLRNVRDAEESGPILIHAITQKGKGYAKAEESADKLHSVSKFNVITGEQAKAPPGPPNYTSVFAKALIDEAERDPTIVGITAAMPSGTGMDKFGKRFPDRCFDVGIAEQHAVTFAAGMATEGMKPFCAIYSTFLQRAYDQVVHDVAIQSLPVRFAMDRAGLVGADGATHAGSFDIAFLRCLPNITLMAPKDENELRSMLATALALPGPSAIRYPRGTGLGVAPEPVAALPVGEAEVLAKGKDGLVVAVGTRVADAATAVAAQAEKGRHFGLVNLRFVKPLDTDTILKHLPKGKPLLVVEEGSRQGGIGEAIAVAALEAGWHGPFAHLGIPDAFPEQGTQAEVLGELGLDAAGIAAALSRL